MAEALCLLLLTSCLSISEPEISAADEAPPETEVVAAAVETDSDPSPESDAQR